MRHFLCVPIVSFLLQLLLRSYPLQEVLKLFMNSSYGKTIQKDTKTEDRILHKVATDSFLKNNYGRVKEVIELNKENLAVSPCYGLDIEKLLYSNTVDTFVMDTDFKFSLAMTKTYITVQAVLDDSEIPSLSTDKNNISLDKVVFDGNYPKVDTRIS